MGDETGGGHRGGLGGLGRHLQGPRVDVPTLTDHRRLLLLGARTAPSPDPKASRTRALGRWETLFGVW